MRNAKSDYDPQSGPDVTMGLSATARRRFQAVTTRSPTGAPDAEHRGAVRGHPRRQARDHPVRSRSSTPDGIDGNAQINDLTQSDANRIALVLQSGSLPVTFVPLSQTQVSATLGKESLRQGLIAGRSAC